MRATLILTFRILVSLALLYLALRGINVMAIQARLSQINLGWIALGIILITVFQIFLGALRWREISALCEAPLSDLHVQTDALNRQSRTTDTSEIAHASLKTPASSWHPPLQLKGPQMQLPNGGPNSIQIVPIVLLVPTVAIFDGDPTLHCRHIVVVSVPSQPFTKSPKQIRRRLGAPFDRVAIQYDTISDWTW